MSPSSRRAWIEIFSDFYVRLRLVNVALLAEGVDRNILTFHFSGRLGLSPSSRRAWIEISRPDVGPLREYGRPPRGGRG